MMNFRHFSAGRTLKGKSDCRERKWRFSVTNMSAPVHSQYAAMRASAGFNPFHSYLDPDSKGTKKSSSTMVMALINPINSLNSCCVRLELTSSTIVLQILIEFIKGCPEIVLRKVLQFSSFAIPKAKTYIFASITNTKFFLPKFFPCLTEFFNNFVFCHAFEWRRPFSYKFAKFFQMFYRFFGIFSYHSASPLFKVYYKINRLSTFNLLNTGNGVIYD